MLCLGSLLDPVQLVQPGLWHEVLTLLRACSALRFHGAARVWPSLRFVLVPSLLRVGPQCSDVGGRES